MSACEGVPFLLFLGDEYFCYPEYNSEDDPDRSDYMSGSECMSDEGLWDREHDSEDEDMSEGTSLVSKCSSKDDKSENASADAERAQKDAVDASVDAEKPMTAGRANIKGYALLPQAFKNEHPDTIKDVERNHIQVLGDHLTAAFALTVRRHRLILFEAEFRNIVTDADPINAPTSFSVFINVYNRSHSNSIEFDWLRDTYDDFLNLAHFDCSCFYKAIEVQHLALIDELLRSPINFDINYGHHKGRTILHFAVKRHQTALVELLLKRGADVEEDRVEPVYGSEPPEYDDDEEPPKEIRCNNALPLAAKKGFSDIVELLLRYGASPNNYVFVTPLSLAYDNNHLETFRLLLEAEAKGKTDTYNQDVISRALRTCVADHRLSFVELILSHFPVVIDENNKLTFYFAFLNREHGDEQMQCYEKMEAYGFRMEYDNIENSSMLLFGAIINDWAEVVRNLLEGGADVNQVCDVIWRLRLLPRPTGSHLALLPRRVESTEPALDILRECADYLPLHLAAAFAGENVIQVLLDHGADMNAKIEKRTPIYDACRTHNLTALKFLIANGANVQHDPVLIRHAAEHGHPEIVELLLLNRTPLSIEDGALTGLLAQAAARQHVEVINVLFKFGAQPSAGFTIECKRGCTVVPEGNHCATIQTVLDHSFTNVDLIHDATTLIGFLDKYGTDPSRPTCSFCDTCIRSCFNLLARHVIKLESASLSFIDQNVASFWHSVGSLDEFRKNCKAEVSRLKSKRIGNSSVTFYDILTKNVNRLASYAGHKDFVSTMNTREYMNMFPIYGNVLRCQFERGYHRRNLLNRGVEVCEKLSVTFFEKLPDIFKEEVVKYLNNYNLEILKYEFVQFSRNAGEDEIP